MQYWGVLAVVLAFAILVIWRVQCAKKKKNQKNGALIVEPRVGDLSQELPHFSDVTVLPVEKPVEKITEQIETAEVEQSTDVVILHVMAKEGKQFAGYELLQALLSSGMRFGKMNIFHRYRESNTHEDILFSLASATEPGVFDMMNMGAFSCKGLTLFMTKTQEHQSNNERYQLMLSTARHLSEDLQGVLLNSRREVVS